MTSEKIQLVAAEELQVVRIRCAKCQGVAELAVEEAFRRLEQGDCLFCGALFFDPLPGQSPFVALRETLRLCAKLRERMGVEFVIREKGTRHADDALEA